MSGKGTICADEETRDATKRNVMSLSQKVKMLNRLDKGMNTEAVGRPSWCKKLEIFSSRQMEVISGRTTTSAPLSTKNLV